MAMERKKMGSTNSDFNSGGSFESYHDVVKVLPLVYNNFDIIFCKLYTKDFKI